MKNRSFKINDEDCLFNMMRLWTSLDPIFEQLNKDQTRAFDMTVSSSQWLQEWKDAYEQKGRQVSSYNLLRQVINVINAIELSNRKKIIAKPSSGGDTELAGIVTEVLDHFLHRTKFDWRRTKVFNNSIIAKFGVYTLGWSFENNKYGDLEIGDCDPRTVRFEPNYADPTWEQAGYVMRKHQLSFDEIFNKFAGNDEEMQEALISEGKVFYDYNPDKRDKYLTQKLKHLFQAVYETITGSSPNSTVSKFMNWYDPLTGKFDVLELHEKRTERRLVIGDSKRPNKLFDITDSYHGEFERLNEKPPDGYRYNNGEIINSIKERYGFDGEPDMELTTNKYVTAVIPAFRLKVNEQPYPFKIKGYVYIPQYCYDYHADTLKAQSVIDDLIDPQSSYNKMISLNQELLWKYANNGWILDANAINGYEEDWESGRLAPYRRVRPGYINLIKPEIQQTVSPDLIKGMQETPAIMDRIANTSESIRGRIEKGVTSGKHFNAVRSQEEKSFSYMFNNVSNSALSVAESGWAIIQNRVTVPRIFRITQDDGQEKEVRVNEQQYGIDVETGNLIRKVKNDITIGEYDFEISDTPYSGNAKEMEFYKLSELLDALISIGTPKSMERADAIMPILVQAGSFPFGNEIKKTWEQIDSGSPQQQQLQQMMMAIQQIMAKLGVKGQEETVRGQILDNTKKDIEIKQMLKDNILNVKRGNGKAKPQYQLN
jgi:hypothetical protein